jgi:hypothetical protein
MGRRMFLSESYPSAVFAEQAPGPGWTPAHLVTSTPASLPPPTPELRQLPLSDMLGALSTAMAAMPLQETPGDAFQRLAELRARAEGVELAEAYRRQSESTPEL